MQDDCIGNMAWDAGSWLTCVLDLSLVSALGLFKDMLDVLYSEDFLGEVSCEYQHHHVIHGIL